MANQRSTHKAPQAQTATLTPAQAQAWCKANLQGAPAGQAHTPVQVFANVANLPAGQVYASAQALWRAAGASLHPTTGKVAAGSACRNVLRALTNAQATQVFGQGVATGYCGTGAGGTRGKQVTPAQACHAYVLVCGPATAQAARNAALVAQRAQYGRKANGQAQAS